MLKKTVNGKLVDCSAEEEAQILAEWERNDPARQPKQAMSKSLEERVAALEKAVNP